MAWPVNLHPKRPAGADRSELTAKSVHELCGSLQAYATLLEPAAQVGILEQTTITGDDDVSRAREGGGDHRDIAWIVHLHLDVDVGKERRQEDEDIRDIPLGDPVAPQPWPAPIAQPQ